MMDDQILEIGQLTYIETQKFLMSQKVRNFVKGMFEKFQILLKLFCLLSITGLVSTLPSPTGGSGE